MTPFSVTALRAAELPGAAPTIGAIDAAVRAAKRAAPLNEAVWRDIEQPGPDSAGFLVGDRAYVHVARSDNFSPQHWAVGLARTDDDDATLGALVDAAVDHVERHGGGRLVLWVSDAHPEDDPPLAHVGFEPARDLYEMRVPLPIGLPIEFPPDITVRDFVPGRDEAAWLEVNNRAFANHPEQGGWIEATLARRMADSWFDPSTFLLAFTADRLAGFNWCKVHDAQGRDPALGEIFVIGVDPDYAGKGLGRPLALAGLARLHDRGLTTGSLFVAAENERALRLYRGIGFTVHRVDRAYEREVDAA